MPATRHTADMQRKELAKYNIPDSPGVYFFLGSKKEILYIGKATSLRDRLRSYFSSDLIAGRGPRIVKMVEDAQGLKWEETDSMLEALILEAKLIKKHQPPFNVREKDNKSFNYLVITHEAFPRVLVVRGRELELKWKDEDIKELFGPFPQGGQLREALKIVRKIFPYRDKCAPCAETGKSKPCFNRQIGLCPGVCSGEVSARSYAQTIRHISLLFSGKKHALVEKLEKEMGNLAKKEMYEEAATARRQVHALTHIRDISLIRRDSMRDEVPRGMRVEGYDVAHTSGTQSVGVMTVILDGEREAGSYRTFNIRHLGNNDVGSLTQLLKRRFAHPEWPYPRLLVVDGGKGQLNAAKKTLKAFGIEIPVVAVVKDEYHKPREILGDESSAKQYEREILLANAEAHRFSLARHRRKRDKV